MKCTVGEYERSRGEILVEMDEAEVSRKGECFVHLSVEEARNWIDLLGKALKRLTKESKMAELAGPGIGLRKIGEGRK